MLYDSLHCCCESMTLSPSEGRPSCRQIYTVDLKNGEDCAKKFRSNRNLGLLFWAAIIAANLVRSPHDDDDDDGVTAETTG